MDEQLNHTTGDKCYMKFEPYSYFGGVPKKITGTINNTEGKLEWVLNGTWDQKMEGSKVIGEAVVKVSCVGLWRHLICCVGQV